MEQAKLLHDVYAAPPWAMPRAILRAGTVVPITPATNIPQNRPTAIRYWVYTPELQDGYGVGLCNGDFEIVAG